MSAEVSIYSIIPEGSNSISDYIDYSIIYQTLPNINAVKYYIDPVENDKLYISSVSSKGRNFEEFTLESPGEAKELAMVPPVQRFHGADEEISQHLEIDPDTGEYNVQYKIRLKCPNCGEWTDWKDYSPESDFDVQKGEGCTNCGVPVKSGVNIKHAKNGNITQVLKKYRIDLDQSKWSGPTEEGYYYIEIDDPGAIISSYRVSNNEYISNNIDIVYTNNTAKILSLDRFAGYIIAVKEDLLENESSKSGRAFGSGAIGEPIYGQESFIHITDNINTQIFVKGEKATTIAGYYTVLSKYNGSEMSLEDVQSYYTERYMMLGCYDGPALPLWITRDDE